MDKQIKTVGVIGHLGMVGKTTFKYLQDFKEKLGIEVHGYDLREPADKEATFNCDLIFVCVPTPYHYGGSGFDASIIDSVVKEIKDKIVVIKSTVKVGTCDRVQKENPTLKVLFNPEFLSESTCDMDFRNPDRQFVGYTKESYEVATEVLHILPESAYDLICPIKEAELLKYINNMHGVLEVMESNHYYDVCQKEGLDYDRVCKAMVASKWVGCPMGRHYRVIFHKGKRGVGGKCFPKDLNAWLEYCKEQGLDARLLQAARDYNDSLLKAQGLTEESSEQIGSEEDAKRILNK